jgi:hypothetical protein
MGVRLRTRLLAMGIAGLMIMSAPVAMADDPLAGRIVGQLTKSNGEPAADVQVTAYNWNGYPSHSTRTGPDGTYVLPEVQGYPGEDQYKIQFDPRWGLGLPEQWAHRKKTRAEADLITVTPGQDTVVNDVLFPTGSIRVTATDTLTGAPISKFCAEAFGSTGRNTCTENGVATVLDLPPGEYSTRVHGYPDYFDEHSRVTVAADQTATVTAKLAPMAKLAVSVVDAKTKAPVQDACVYAKTGIGSFGEVVHDCTGPDGRLSMTGLTTGAYNLYVQPRDAVHGAQWVGPNGGTGSRLLAKTVNTTAGQTVTVSPILLDGAGSISGTVVDKATNAPAAGVCAFPRAGYAYDGNPIDRPNCTKQDGKYTISGLGPYHWPVNFIDNYPGTHAWQWSGDQPSQLTARLVKVHVGQTATENARLAQGNTLSGNVTVNGVSGYLNVHNAITGDFVGDYTFADEKGDYQFKNIAGNQPVKVVFTDASKPPYNEYWYRDAKTFASARPIPVRPGTPTTGIDFVITPR